MAALWGLWPCASWPRLPDLCRCRRGKGRGQGGHRIGEGEAVTGAGAATTMSLLLPAASEGELRVAGSSPEIARTAPRGSLVAAHARSHAADFIGMSPRFVPEKEAAPALERRRERLPHAPAGSGERAAAGTGAAARWRGPRRQIHHAPDASPKSGRTAEIPPRRRRGTPAPAPSPARAPLAAAWVWEPCSSAVRERGGAPRALFFRLRPLVGDRGGAPLTSSPARAPPAIAAPLESVAGKFSAPMPRSPAMEKAMKSKK